jgi:hypothetical protein
VDTDKEVDARDEKYMLGHSIRYKRIHDTTVRTNGQLYFEKMKDKPPRRLRTRSTPQSHLLEGILIPRASRDEPGEGHDRLSDRSGSWGPVARRLPGNLCGRPRLNS